MNSHSALLPYLTLFDFSLRKNRIEKREREGGRER